jgi:RecB family endonuclease NucS
MEKILGQRFGMDVIAPRVRARRNGHSMEVDVLAYSHSNDQVFVVEVKSHLRDEALDQLRRTLDRFREFFPEHKDKKLFGILAAVDAPDQVRDKALQEGFYLARIHDGQFEIQVPEDFQPRAF